MQADLQSQNEAVRQRRCGMQFKFRKTFGACALLVGSLFSVVYGQQFSSWSAPVNLGPVINSPTGDFFPYISRDGLSLFFTSVTCIPTPFPGCRPGYGGWDIFVSQRASVNDPWGLAQNLGPEINTASNEMAPALTVDGHTMYFASNKPGGLGGTDIYMSRRHNKRDDLGWQVPENLGSGVNTISNDSSPQIFEDDATGVTTLYFDSNRPGGLGPSTDDGNGNGNDIYASVLQRDGAFGPAAIVAELSTASIDRHPAISRDGLEMYIASNRPGTLGGVDLWASTRGTTIDPWSPPVNLGAPINSTAADAGPALSFDGTALYFQTVRSDGSGAFDLYVCTRTKLKGEE